MNEKSLKIYKKNTDNYRNLFFFSTCSPGKKREKGKRKTRNKTTTKMAPKEKKNFPRGFFSFERNQKREKNDEKMKKLGYFKETT